jgi:hypothetical protein
MKSNEEVFHLCELKYLKIFQDIDLKNELFELHQTTFENIQIKLYLISSFGI